MFKLIIAFVIGIGIAYYTVPELKAPFDSVVKTFNISQYFEPDELHHTSNTFNATPPDEFENLGYKYNISAKVNNAITMISAHNLNEQTSDYAVSVITDLIDEEPRLQEYVRSKMSDGITNKEALHIFEQYFSLQG